MDRERGTPVRDDTIWRIYSMTKPITGVALLTLYEQGLFQLNDPSTAICPSSRDMKVTERPPTARASSSMPQRPITVRDAMMHMTGIGYGPASARRLDMRPAVGGHADARAGARPRGHARRR